MERNFRLTPASQDIYDHPDISDLSATIGLIDSLLGFDQFDNMSVMLETVATIEKTAERVGIDVNEADTIFELRQMMIERFNGYVSVYNKDPEGWIMQYLVKGWNGENPADHKEIYPKLSGSRYM